MNSHSIKDIKCTKQIDSDRYMTKLSKLWRNRFDHNIYKLNEKALIIQHWFFRTKLKNRLKDT